MCVCLGWWTLLLPRPRERKRRLPCSFIHLQWTSVRNLVLFVCMYACVWDKERKSNLETHCEARWQLAHMKRFECHHVSVWLSVTASSQGKEQKGLFGCKSVAVVFFLVFLSLDKWFDSLRFYLSLYPFSNWHPWLSFLWLTLLVGCLMMVILSISSSLWNWLTPW